MISVRCTVDKFWSHSVTVHSVWQLRACHIPQHVDNELIRLWTIFVKYLVPVRSLARIYEYMSSCGETGSDFKWMYLLTNEFPPAQTHKALRPLLVWAGREIHVVRRYTHLPLSPRELMYFGRLHISIKMPLRLGPVVWFIDPVGIDCRCGLHHDATRSHWTRPAVHFVFGFQNGFVRSRPDKRIFHISF